MNKYYYCKATNITCCYTIISNDGFIVGKILKIDSLASGDIGSRYIGENNEWTPSLCHLVTDPKIIHDLDKLIIFSNE